MISIIIPAYNEADKIGELLAYLKANSDLANTEIIIVDGGSTDNTRSIANQNGVIVIKAPKKGRGHQMNYGASKASGDLLYFLHADTFPPPTFTADILKEVNKGYGSGCFRLKFDKDHIMLKFYAWFTRFDIDLFRFGDQSLFVRRKVFEKAGGFNEHLLVMEDQEIIRRLKNHAPFTIIKKSATTSARKYEQLGILKLQLIFTLIVLVYYLGLSQKVIAHFYKEMISDQI